MIQVDTKEPNLVIVLVGDSNTVKIKVDTKGSKLITTPGVVIGELQDNRVTRRLAVSSKNEVTDRLKSLCNRIQEGNLNVTSEESKVLDIINGLNMDSILRSSPDIQLVSLSNMLYDIVYNNVIQQLSNKKLLKILDKAIVDENNRINKLPYNIRLKYNLPLAVGRYSTLERELKKIECGEPTNLRLSKNSDKDYSDTIVACTKVILEYIEKHLIGEMERDENISVYERLLKDFDEVVYRIHISICKAIEKYIDAEGVAEIGDKVIMKVRKHNKLEELEVSLRFIGCEAEYMIKVKVV